MQEIRATRDVSIHKLDSHYVIIDDELRIHTDPGTNAWIVEKMIYDEYDTEHGNLPAWREVCRISKDIYHGGLNTDLAEVL